MKKIFFLLLACTLLAACDNDDDSKVTPEKPYFNPVEGNWKSTDDINSASKRIRVFTKDFHQYIYVYSNNVFTGKLDQGQYTIDKSMLYSATASANYKIVEDTLFIITAQQTTQWTKTDEVLPE